jgi:hypothetical protein
MTKIIKRLSKENFKRILSGNIRIGSLRYYRNIEDENRNDTAEGLIPLHIKAENGDRIVKRSEFNKMAFASGSAIRINEDKFKIRMREGVTFTSSSDINAYMFCTTLEEDLNRDLDEKFGGYKIEITNPREFGQVISGKLAEETFNNKTLIAKGVADSFMCGQAKVLYKPKESIDFDTLDKSGNEPSINIDGMFIKPSGQGFEEDKEYRFIWYPSHNPTQTMCSIPMDFEFVDLHIPEIKDFIKSIT